VESGDGGVGGEGCEKVQRWAALRSDGCDALLVRRHHLVSNSATIYASQVSDFHAKLDGRDK